MARAPAESRIPVFRSSGGLPALVRPTMLVAPGESPSAATSPGPASPLTENPAAVLEGCVSTADVGQRVCVAGQVTGVLRFYGTTHLDPYGSLWCGVELDTPDGLNDGCIKGIRYFRCRPNYGILAPEKKVRLVDPPASRSKHSMLPHSAIKRRPPQSRDAYTAAVRAKAASRSRTKTDSGRDKTASGTSGSGSGSSQDEITPPVEEQPQPNRSEVPRQPRSAAATPTPGSSGPPWDTWTGKISPVEGDVPLDTTLINSSLDTTLVAESPSKEIVLESPTGSEGRSITQQRRLTAGLVLPLTHDSSPAGGSSSQPIPPGTLGSKQSSFELDDSLGILTPDQMVTDFTVTSAGAGSEDDERPGSAELGGLIHEDVPPSPPPLLDDTLLPPPSPAHTQQTHEPEDHSEQFSDMSSAADTTSKGAAHSSSQASSSIVQQSCSTATAAGTSLAPACSFITSVTSITSLDNGYQGDGEWSRPTSRADNSPGAPPPPPPGVLAVDVHKLKFDVMTDSDFFSDPGAAGPESDAEHEAAGMAIGDRRARVIDGTLYGTSPANSVTGPLPAAPAHLMTSSAATIEEMDSSGIFSDMERRMDHSETFSVPIRQPSEAESAIVPADVSAIEPINEEPVPDVLNTTEESVTTTEASPKVAAPTSANNKEEKVVKKHKMPKRNVVSKIKALIEASPTTKTDENQENRRPARKGGKWDAVMNKIAQNQAEEKARPKIKEVKSRVFASMATPVCPQSPKAVRSSTASPRSNVSRPSSARTRRENAAAPKPKPRRSRLRGAESSASLQRVTGEEEEEEDGPSPNSSHCSSISDVSQDPCCSKPSPPRSTKKRAAALDGVASAHLVRSGSPLSDVSTNSAATQPSTRTPANNNNNALHSQRSSNSPGERAGKTSTPNSGVSSVQQRNQRNSLLSASTPPSRRGATPGTAHKAPQEKSSVSTPTSVNQQTPEMKTPIPLRKQQTSTPRLTQKPTPLRDHNRLSGTRQSLHNGDGGKTEVPAVTNTSQSSTKSTVVPATLPPHLLKELKHASAGCEAMAVLVQYLVHSMDAFSTPRLKAEVATTREEWVRTKLELEEAHASYRRLQETLSDEVAAHERREEARRVEHEEAVAALVKQHAAALEAEQLERKKIDGVYRIEMEVHRNAKEAADQTVTSVMRQLAEARVQAARHTEESARREAELGEQLAKVSTELAEAKANSQKFWSTVNKDKDAKLQLSVDQCQTLQKEVDSLRAVLELKSAELQSLRKACATAQESAEKVPSLEIALGAARTKIEDLQSQLDSKINIERQLKDENKSLNESYMMEAQNTRRLTQDKEELQWKLKQSSEMFNKLASSNSSYNNSMLFPISPLLARRTPNSSNGGSFNNSSHRLSPGLDDELPDSPRVTMMAEKTDSIAWRLDMEETVDAMMERVNSNHRQRCQDRSSPGRSLPKKSASTSAILSEQRGKLAGRKSRLNRAFTTSTPAPDTRCRSRSVSTDSESLELEGKSCSSQPERRENGMSESKIEQCLTLPSQSNSQSTATSPSSMLTLPFKIQLQPQEGAGEAMISEEISDDAQSDCEANQAACSGRSSESSSLVLANGAQLDDDDDDDNDDEDVEEEVQQQMPAANNNNTRLICPAQNLRSSPTLDSASQLGLTDNTAMDLSWSEDFELFPSECEG